MKPEVMEADFQEWIDAYWSKDIQELFRLERRHSFLQFCELLFIQSGGIFEAARFAAPCEVSRTTIMNYLSVLEATFIAHIIRPVSRRRSSEIIAAPKVYGFDSGFVAFFKGLHPLRIEDKGLLWEHLVLNEIIGRLQRRAIFYWRDKRGHEIDFIIKEKGGMLHAIECKWSPDNFDPVKVLSFRYRYPAGDTFVVVPHLDRTFSQKYNGCIVKFVSLSRLIDILKTVLPV